MTSRHWLLIGAGICVLRMFRLDVKVAPSDDRPFIYVTDRWTGSITVCLGDKCRPVTDEQGGAAPIVCRDTAGNAGFGMILSPRSACSLCRTLPRRRLGSERLPDQPAHRAAARAFHPVEDPSQVFELAVATAEPMRRDGPWPSSAQALQADHVRHREIIDADHVRHRDEDWDIGHVGTYAEHRLICKARMEAAPASLHVKLSPLISLHYRG